MRGDGGYVVAPPSPGYEPDEEAPAAEAPGWLVALVREASRDGATPAADEMIPAGRRNDTLTSFAGTMRRRGMSEAAIAAALKIENAKRCTPQLPEIEVERIAASVARYEPADTPAPTAELLVDMEEAMKLAEVPIAYAVKPIAARGFLTVLAGQHSSGKSWLAIMAGHAAHRGGGQVAELRCEQTTVLYVDAENGPRLMGRRFKAAGIPSDGLLIADGTKLRLPRDLGQLRALIADTGAGLVVLDSLRRLAPGIRENESDDMASMIADIGTIARDLDIAILLIHHRSTKKGAATLRGSSTIEDQADLVFALERVADDRDRDRHRLRPVKFRIDAEPMPIWLRMGMVDGRFAVRTAERYDGADGDAEEEGAEEQLAKRIDALADQVRAGRSDGWPPARLAVAVGSDQRSGTFQRAIRCCWRGARGCQRVRPAPAGSDPPPRASRANP